MLFSFCRFLGSLFTVVPLCFPIAAHAVTRVLITIDVESNGKLTLPQQVDTVCKDGVACGLMEIARMIERRRWAGTFFLSVYEHRYWGEATMRDIVTKLQAAGQDVALHTHPQAAYDPSRWAMFEYNLDEQVAIIRDGVRLLEAWTGHPVVAHRAGAYTADQHTLEALERNGIRIDSSLFWEHPWSRLNGLGMPRNLPSSWHELTEIPVTVYQREDRPPMIGDLVHPAASIRKIDPNWFMNREEAISAIDAVVKADLPFLVIFLHSFSLMERQEAGIPLTDRHALDIYGAMLDHIAEKHLPVVTMRDLPDSAALPVIAPHQDVIPRVTVQVSMHRYLFHRLKTAGLVALAAMGGIVLTLVGGGAALLISARRRRLVAGKR